MKKVTLALLFGFSLIYGQEAEKDSIQSEEEKQIKAVELIAKKKLVGRKADRLVFNVEQSVSATGGDVMDILRITPSVRVENDNISMLGKSSVLVLVDDRSVQMSGADLVNYLKTLKSDEIKSIEVIKNPPAKYTAEGNGGVLNIVTKKAKKNAWNATLRGSYTQASYPSGGLGAGFNLQRGRWTLTSAVNYNDGNTRAVDNSEITYPDEIWKASNVRKASHHNSWSTRLGLDYQISEKWTTGFLYRWSDGSNSEKNRSTTNVFDAHNGALDREILSQGKLNGKGNSHLLNYHWIYKMDSVGRKLTFDYDMMANINENQRHYWSENPISEGKNGNIQQVNNHTFSIDMEHPLEKIKLNYGARISMTKIENDSKFYNVAGGITTLDLGRSNEFHYRENTQALYASAEKNFGEKWSAKAGLRVENTQTEGKSKTIAVENKNHYTQFFPTLYVSYSPNENRSFSLDYGRRISRPNYRMLNPFRWVSSPYSYSEGNPLLKPSYTHNLTLNYTYKDWSDTSLYYSYKEDGYEQLGIIDPTTNITQYIPVNFYTQRKIGVWQSFRLKPIKKYWDINLNLEVSYNHTTSNHASTLPYLKGWDTYFKMTNNVSLNEKKTLQLGIDYFFYPKGVDVLDHLSMNNSLSASFKMLLLKKKMVVNLYMNDIFSSNRLGIHSYSNGIRSSYKNYYDARYVRLSITYNLGKTFNKKDHQNKNQEEFNRAQ